MTRLALVSLALLVTTLPARAHSLDEYVQATRVELTSTAIVLHLGLTPGIAVAPQILGRLDRDRDGRVAPLEAEAYGRDVLTDLTLILDGRSLSLQLTRIEVPTPDELGVGQGTIRVEAVAKVDALTGRHHMTVRNAHLPEVSVYLGNALLSDTARLTVVRQERDARQQELRLEYDVDRPHTATLAWIVGGTALLLLHTAWRRRAPIDALS
jgi:hypothetical protein